MTRRLLIVHPTSMDGENSGVFIQHVASMQWLLTPDRGWSVVALDPLHPDFPEAVLGSDLVIAHMLAHREIEAVIRLRRARGLRTIFEIADNFLDLGGWLPKRNLLRSPLVRQNILFHASLCDAVQVYSSGLAELARRVNPNVLVLDPYVPLSDPLPKGGQGVVVGWGGTSSHEEDLARIAPVIIDFCLRHRDVRFAFMGDRRVFDRHFGMIPSEQTHVQPFSDHESWLQFVRSLDIGLAPLRDTPFNACRTDTKFATYAACGVAAVLEDAPAHRPHGERAILFRTNAELAEALEALHDDRSRIAALADRGHAWARRERSAERLREQRERLYRPLLPADHGTTWDVQPSPLSGRLVRAAALDPGGALAVALEILSDHPDYAAACLLAARSLESLGRLEEALQTIESFAFPAIYGDLVAERQTRLARKVRPEEVSGHLARIESPLVRLRLQHCEQKDPGAFYRAVLQHQPYDYFALAAVIRLIRRTEQNSAELDQLYERACLVAPETVPQERRPSHLARFLPAVQA